ncbi:hypothetical protein IGL98_000577 [Enterococcus sp. DIV0840]
MLKTLDNKKYRHYYEYKVVNIHNKIFKKEMSEIVSG